MLLPFGNPRLLSDDVCGIAVIESWREAPFKWRGDFGGGKTNEPDAELESGLDVPAWRDMGVPYGESPLRFFACG